MFDAFRDYYGDNQVALDNGYISDFLIHWTGKKGFRSGFVNLTSILTKKRLKLGYNPFVWLDFRNAVADKMVCFTDVPIQHSRIHCRKYGKFGIAFSKRLLANIGAHPVFYYTHTSQQDIKKIINFLLADDHTTAIPRDIFAALKRHFYFCQEYGRNRIDSRDALYYEREWRLGEQNLDEQHGQNGVKYRRVLEDKPRYFGKLVREGHESFMEFDDQDVAFLILPRRYKNMFRKTFRERCWEIKFYEDIVA